MWEKELVDVVWPECNASSAQRWEGSTKTALASFPRSGNTFTRELVERSSHWQTSTVGYCDHALRVTLHGEVRPFLCASRGTGLTHRLLQCDDDARFLVKTHYPEVPPHVEKRASSSFTDCYSAFSKPPSRTSGISTCKVLNRWCTWVRIPETFSLCMRADSSLFAVRNPVRCPLLLRVQSSSSPILRWTPSSVAGNFLMSLKLRKVNLTMRVALRSTTHSAVR